MIDETICAPCHPRTWLCTVLTDERTEDNRTYGKSVCVLTESNEEQIVALTHDDLLLRRVSGGEHEVWAVKWMGKSKRQFSPRLAGHVLRTALRTR